MKKITTIVCILLIMVSFSSAALVQRQTTSDNYAEVDITSVQLMPSIYSKNYDEELENIGLLKWNGPQGSYEDYIKSRDVKLFSVQKIAEYLDAIDETVVIVFVDSDLMPNIEEDIEVYSSTLTSIGYDVVVLEVSGGTVEDLKNQIVSYWDTGYNLTGVVLIGDFPVAWFYCYEEGFPCDLFLMDLDGKWIDSNNDGLYDSHTDGSGDTAPEIYIGRIDVSNIPTGTKNRISIIKKYLYKVHEFWMDNISRTRSALTYTDCDWKGCEDLKHDIGYAYDDYETIVYPDVNRNDYVNNRLPDSYEFIQLACHSWSFGHFFDNGGTAFSFNIRLAPPMALFYNLFCCGALRFTDYNCLGNAYILNTNSPSLAVVGSTKSGSMLDFRFFYEPIGLGYSFGKAFQKWFEHEYPYGEGDVSWFYGMTILGDPTLILYRDFGVHAYGPYYGLIDEPIQFRGSARGGVPQYAWHWDFGDGDSSYEQNPTHIYTEPGNYTVIFTVTDNTGNSTSDTTWAKIKEYNNPPDKPSISGSTYGKKGQFYDYDFVAVDPDGDEWVYYYIDWGDNTSTRWIGPYNSGETITRLHKWTNQGTYTIKCKAKDSYGAEGLNGELTVTMPRNKAFNFNFNLLEWLFEQFTNAFPVLRHIMGL
ncbi:MAG: PKD domain-containing protein [Thermoplasmatales archaeon]|nr:PKD domain-containing protein [Thermoplasmatales archaeon]